MTLEDFITQSTSEALILTVIVSLPAILASLGTGLIVALFSATTQIQEQTLSFAPKMVIVYLSLIISGSWVGGLLFNFSTRCFEEFSNFIH